ncbi:MAG TPA: ChaN family lipoprotein [bacterium]|jgi:uncharacterized iron-regulated protein
MKNSIITLTIFSLLLLAFPAYASDVVLPNRVIDTRTMTIIDFEGLVYRCSNADIVTFGENHDDPATHAMELAVMQGIYRYNGSVVLTMEMFERDVQDILNSYLAGEIDETTFLETSRPWGNYDTDYRPMIEFAKEIGEPVIAANCPRDLAHKASVEGYFDADWTDEELDWIASTYEAPRDAYWEKFFEVMSGPAQHGDATDEDSIYSFYQAQCLKDETMAESITRASIEYEDSVIYHVNGNFHTGDYLGTFSRVKRNMPSADAVSIIAIPVEDLINPDLTDYPMADYWIIVLAPEPEPEEEEPEENPGADRFRGMINQETESGSDSDE